MEINPTRVCELLVGLPEVNVVGVDDGPGLALRVHVESRLDQGWCRRCGVRAQVKDRPEIVFVDLPCFGRPTRLVWHKQRWRCREPENRSVDPGSVVGRAATRSLLPLSLGWLWWRRWTGIEPAGRGSPVPPALKAGEPTRYSYTSVNHYAVSMAAQEAKHTSAPRRGMTARGRPGTVRRVA